MPIKTDSINQDLYELLDSRGYDPRPMGADANNAGKTVDPREADVIRFTFKIDDQKVDDAFVTIDSGKRMVLYFDDQKLNAEGDKRSKNSTYDDSWFKFLDFLKRWAFTKRLSWDLKPKRKVNSDMELRNNMKKKEELQEGYYPMGKTASYNDNIPSIKIVLQHTRQIQEGEQRYRNIARIFLENTHGERILAPTVKPGIAQVYARHLAEGGVPNDERWNHIKSLCEEYSKMAGFVRAVRSNQFNESAQRLVEAGLNHYTSLRETLGKMRGHRGYTTYFESWTPTLMETEGDDTVNLNELFVQETLDPRIESVIPILRKLKVNLGEMKEVIDLAEWADKIIEDEGIQSKNPQGIPEGELEDADIADKKIKIPAALRKAKGNDWKVTHKDLDTAKAKTGTSPEGLAALKKLAGLKDNSVTDDLLEVEGVEESGLQAYLGNKKYGKEGMDALRQAGREGAGKEEMAKIRAKYDKLDEESFELDEGTWTTMRSYRVKDPDLIDLLSSQDGAEMEMIGDVGILAVDTISFPELARMASYYAKEKKIEPIAGHSTRDITGKAVQVGNQYIKAPSPRDPKTWSKDVDEGLWDKFVDSKIGQKIGNVISGSSGGMVGGSNKSSSSGTSWGRGQVTPGGPMGQMARFQNRTKNESMTKINDHGEQTESYTVTRGIDKEKYQERQGLEGPFSTKSGKVVYYDPHEGKYYDPDTDMYIEYDDWEAMNEQGVAEGSDWMKPLRSPQPSGIVVYYRHPDSGKIKGIFIERLKDAKDIEQALKNTGSEIQSIALKYGNKIDHGNANRDNPKIKDYFNVLQNQGVAEGMDPEKRARLDDLIDQYRDSTDPNDYYDREYNDPEEVIELIRAEFGDKIASKVEAGADKMHFPRPGHTDWKQDPLGWKKPVDRLTKTGKMYKQDSDFRKNTIQSRYALSGKSATEGVAEGVNEDLYITPQWKKYSTDDEFTDALYHFFDLVDPTAKYPETPEYYLDIIQNPSDAASRGEAKFARKLKGKLDKVMATGKFKDPRKAILALAKQMRDSHYEQGVAEGSVLQSIKRAIDGWGAFDKDKPADVVNRVKSQDTATLKKLLATDSTRKGSPAELQQKAIRRELEKRGEQGVEEGLAPGLAAWKKEMIANGAVSFKRDQHGGGAVDRIVAYDKDGKVVGGFNRKGVAENLDVNQKRVGQLGPTGRPAKVGDLVGANESAVDPKNLQKVRQGADPNKGLDDKKFGKPGPKNMDKFEPRPMQKVIKEMDKSQPSSDRGGESSGNPYAKGGKGTPVKTKDMDKDAGKELNKAMDKAHKKDVKEGQEDLDAILRIIRK